MTTTAESQSLLREYVSSQSEAAFRRIVEAHTPLVFSAAVRFSGGDVHLAQDIAQTTFISLAQQARHLSPDIILSAWLYRHACLTARHSLRADARRRARESAAALMNEPAHDPWPAIAPVLDDAMAALSGSDRAALVLRYFENQDLRTAGHTLGLSDDAAQKRVARALERLRGLLTRRGAVITLGIVLAALIPIGMQYHANSGARSRVAALTTSVEAMRSAVGPAAPRTLMDSNYLTTQDTPWAAGWRQTRRRLKRGLPKPERTVNLRRNPFHR